MDLATIKSLLDVGLGPLAFLALMYGVYQMFLVLKELATNHITHIQESLDRIEALMNKLLERNEPPRL